MNIWKVKDGEIDLDGLPIVMGILNVTPDSFSDGGKYIRPDQAFKQAEKMVEDGAQIIDVGGESTRPGAEEVSAEEEIHRIVPVIERIAKNLDVKISVDTYKAKTADAALKAGAHIVNDVYGFQYDPDIARVTSMHKAGAVLMSNALMRKAGDIIKFKNQFLNKSIAIAHRNGIKNEQIVLDPGVGFGTTRNEDIRLINDIDAYRRILLGVSRKRIVDHLLGGETEPIDRVYGSVGLALAGAMRGAKILRVHDVKETYEALKTFEAVKEAEKWTLSL